MWAGTINLDVDGWLVGVEYDTAETAAAIEARCRRWLSDDQRPIAAAFGIRTAPVGLRRRRLGLVHYGTAVRQRTPDVATAIEVLAAILTDMSREVGDDLVSVPLRVFVNGSRAVLVDAPRSHDIDDRPLRKRGIVEVPTWQAIVDPGRGRIVGADADVVGIVSGRSLPATTADDLRRHLWSLANGDRGGWAALLDRIDNSRLVWSEDVARGSASCWRHDQIGRPSGTSPPRHGVRPGFSAQSSPSGSDAPPAVTWRDRTL